LKIEILHQLVEEKELQKQQQDSFAPLSPDIVATRKSQLKEHEHERQEHVMHDQNHVPVLLEEEEGESLMTALTGRRLREREAIDQSMFPFTRFISC
jgi:hypothetical protein